MTNLNILDNEAKSFLIMQITSPGECVLMNLGLYCSWSNFSAVIGFDFDSRRVGKWKVILVDFFFLLLVENLIKPLPIQSSPEVSFTTKKLQHCF